MTLEETIFQKPGGSVRSLHRQPALLFSLFCRFCQHNRAARPTGILRFAILWFCPIQAGPGIRRGGLTRPAKSILFSALFSPG
jgi:hypothetical protein